MARKSSGLADQNKTRRLLSAIPCGFARPPTALRKGRLDDGQTGHKRDTDPNHEDDTRRGSDRRERA